MSSSAKGSVALSKERNRERFFERFCYHLRATGATFGADFETSRSFPMRTALLASALLALCLAGAVQAQTASRAIAFNKSQGGGSAGSGTVTEGPRGVLLKLEVSGLTPGWHGIHFHEKGDCSAADFTSAGSHVHGPAAVVHGLLNPAHSDLGDLPNIFVGADGKATVELFSPFVALTDAAGRQNLLDADGSAVVIHANADDHTSQPIGGAGARVACGVVK
jgi:Cu-Zn family superoxide dismutase